VTCQRPVDTYRTQDHADDPPTPHISLHSPPNAHHRFSLGCVKPSHLPPIVDGATYDLVSVYDGASSRVRVSLNGIDLIDVAVPRGTGDWYMGVTAACGGLYQTVSQTGLSTAHASRQRSSNGRGIRSRFPRESLTYNGTAQDIVRLYITTVLHAMHHARLIYRFAKGIRKPLNNVLAFS
jgi:hypothetical protein